MDDGAADDMILTLALIESQLDDFDTDEVSGWWQQPSLSTPGIDPDPLVLVKCVR